MQSRCRSSFDSNNAHGNNCSCLQSVKSTDGICGAQKESHARVIRGLFVGSRSRARGGGHRQGKTPETSDGRGRGGARGSRQDDGNKATRAENGMTGEHRRHGEDHGRENRPAHRPGRRLFSRAFTPRGEDRTGGPTGGPLLCWSLATAFPDHRGGKGRGGASERGPSPAGSAP